MKKLFVVVLAGFSLSGTAQVKKLCAGMFPQNNKYIGVEVEGQGIDQATFDKILDHAQAVYDPIVEAHGYRLYFNRLWTDGTVNSDTYTSGGQWVIDSYGGLARYKGMTADGYAAVVCHELGHHLGGAPTFGFGQQMSVEGEADYHVGTKCLRKLFANDDNVQLMAGATIDPLVATKCATAFPGDAGQIALCERSAAASFAVADVLRDLEKGKPLAFNTPDPTVVNRTDEDHPAAQCRLDTYFNSGVCPVSSDIELGMRDDHLGACVTGDGVRPRCWYKPD